MHCEAGTGIPEHLQLYAPTARPLVITFHPASSLHLTPQEFVAAGLNLQADYVVLTLLPPAQRQQRQQQEGQQQQLEQERQQRQGQEQQQLQQ